MLAGFKLGYFVIIENWIEKSSSVVEYDEQVFDNDTAGMNACSKRIRKGS